ncbi:Rrf2 family transcriptional regulator [Oryzicola mucosus]|uniref:Rrf2 family transcriptional regulator n=1 Tax=Oryzicola mucosus TaxID=2767425 RepID=A0A8J6PTM3_9HYPH|nr:Rrf2 family transcriptional regulator [Oryzicola mucosus]
MRQDGRLSRLLHVLLHMDGQEKPVTSEMIGRMLNTNATLVRRTMAGLREAGYVTSEKGHGGGWTLVRPLTAITLLDVYRALGKPELFAFGLSEDMPSCLVERAVNQAISETRQEAETLLLERFGQISLADIAKDFGTRSKAKAFIHNQ